MHSSKSYLLTQISSPESRENVTSRETNWKAAPHNLSFHHQNSNKPKVANHQSVTYRYREFPVLGFFLFFSGIGTGTFYWYRKKVSEPVSEKFGTEKSTGISIENIWHRKKVSVSVSFNILGTVTHW